MILEKIIHSSKVGLALTLILHILLYQSCIQGLRAIIHVGPTKHCSCYMASIVFLLMELSGFAQEIVISIEELVCLTFVRKLRIMQLPMQARDLELHQQRPSRLQDPPQTALRVSIDPCSGRGAILNQTDPDNSGGSILVGCRYTWTKFQVKSSVLTA